LEALEQKVEDKGGMQQVLAEHFAEVYKVSMSPPRAILAYGHSKWLKE
jgi:hypothetical protein